MNTAIISDPKLTVAPSWFYFAGDCRSPALNAKTADLVFTSPPYWKKIDYGFSQQLGREETLEEYAANIRLIAQNAKNILTRTGSLILNVADSVEDGEQIDVIGKLIAEIKTCGFSLRQKIVWVKPHRKPQPPSRRLLPMEETLLHFSLAADYFTDIFGLRENLGAAGAAHGNVWQIEIATDESDHPCPFPVELARRALLLSCPAYVCAFCRSPLERVVVSTDKIDVRRWQARRARSIYEQSDLSPQHLEAVRAVGLSDSPKAGKQQTGAGRNAAATVVLADEAKRVLGSYAREFLMSIKETAGWRQTCNCIHAGIAPGRVFDPCAGGGATFRAANELNRAAIGCDRQLYESMRHFLQNRKQAPLFL